MLFKWFKMTKAKRVVISGIGVVSPLANTTAATWDAVVAGHSGASRVTKFDVEAYACHIACEVKGFDPLSVVDAKELKKLDMYSIFAMAAAQEAWEQALLPDSSFSPSRMGCILGVGIGGLTTLEKYHVALLNGGPRKISPFLIPAMITNLGPGNVAIRFGLKGVNFTVTSACASATHAIGEAYRMIASGIQDVMVTGGAESSITPIGIGGFCALKALSTRNDAPKKASRPFDADRDGFVMGEGAAILILESLESAEKRGAPIYAEVVGYGASCDAYHITAPSADGEGAVSCMRNALVDANVQAEQIGYINAHGTSTGANDVSETSAIKALFGDWAKNGLLVSSTKSMTGHLLGAAGAIEAAFSAMALRDGIIPPTINLDNPGEGCDLDYVPHKHRKVQVDYALSNSFGFGGTNASLVLGRLK